MQRKLKFIMALTGLVLAFTMFNDVSAASYTVTDDSYGTYFNASGYIKDSDIHAGDVLDVSGTLNNKSMYIDRPLNVTSASKTGKLVNGTINILSGGSGSNVTNLRINNTQDGVKGISLLYTQNNTIKGNTIQSDGSGGYAIFLTGSDYNNILNNNLSEFETSVGWTHSPILLGNSSLNNIKNNYIISSVSNCIYLCVYGSGGGLCYYNNITDNTCIGANTSWCYAIQVMGSYNNVTNNKVTGAYRGISSEQDTEGGNTITGNIIRATYCGIYFNSNCTVYGNTISGYGSTDNGISAYGSGATIKNNIINLTNGYGIYLAGSNCTITGNNITTTGDKESIYVYGKIDNNTFFGNVINSNSTGILLKKQSSSKLPTNTKINSNNITTTAAYAVDSSEGSSTTITDNFLASNGNVGNDAVNSVSGDIITGNYGKLIPSANIGSGSFNKGISVTLTAKDSQDPNPKIYYTLNGSTPTAGSTLYTGPISINSEGTTTLKFIAVNEEGDISDVVTKVYTIDKRAPTASASVKGGLYNVNKVVTLKMSEAGSIYYTLNGVTPTTSSKKYTGAFNVTSTHTLKFLAVDAAGNKSPVYTVKYTIDKTAPKVSAVSPKNGVTGVSRTKTVSVRLSENVLKGTNWSKVYIKNLKTGQKCKATIWISGDHIYIKTAKKAVYSWYQVYIPASAVKDSAGNKLAKAYSFKFKTGK